MKRFLTLAILAAATTGSLHAASMNYIAFVSCPSCITVSLSWANEPVPISFAEVDDNLGDLLFALNVGFPPRTTGSIVPNPQTVSGLPPSVMDFITNGQAGVATASLGVALNSFKTLELLDSENNVIDSRVFKVDVTAVPEPAVWVLFAAGMVLVYLRSLRWRRNP